MLMVSVYYQVHISFLQGRASDANEFGVQNIGSLLLPFPVKDVAKDQGCNFIINATEWAGRFHAIVPDIMYMLYSGGSSSLASRLRSLSPECFVHLLKAVFLIVQVMCTSLYLSVQSGLCCNHDMLLPFFPLKN